ncbi:uncharacterized protein BX663DRAFT_45681 [Cokeromyces recurvatus]|uniref:uncharacterized protein n=1 Tax=Cokeromyces recurvatus TaxID=90255 RepID=UPI00221EEACF|nr:uncharacterized protein BX663DRAFT_45681 [Cokeromyces recurvatus]KAI7903251.1 hypothetical protein BX663DRAFT_45681 [Cokeromyces recurvatus]
MTYLSESSSTSSRSISRLSNYSATSSTTTSGIPLPRKNSLSKNNVLNAGTPTQSRSYNSQQTNNDHGNKKGVVQRSQLAKRASHIPAPVKSSYLKTPSSPPPTPQRTSSTENQRKISYISSSPQKRIPQQRASHIPTVRETIHRPDSPISYSPSRISIRSPTPGGGSRTSLFSSSNHQKSYLNSSTNSIASSSYQEGKRAGTPTNTRPSSLRPPGSIAGTFTNLRSVSRMSTLKKYSS